MAVGLWTGGSADPSLFSSSWQQLDTLDEPLPDQIVVSASGWTSFLYALDRSPTLTASVILLLPPEAAPPPRAREVADAVVDPSTLDSALRLTDTDLADLVAPLDERALTDLAFAPTTKDRYPLGGRILDGVDLTRAAQAAYAEIRYRATVAAPLRRAAAVEADILPREAAHTVLAAVVLLALLRAGMRMPPSLAIRGVDLTDAPGVEQAIAQALGSGDTLGAILPGTTVAIALDGETLQFHAADVLNVLIEVAGETRWQARGRTVAVPLDLFSQGPARLILGLDSPNTDA